MMELDLMERNVLKAIEISSEFRISDIIKVYENVRSFDKTISVLKKSVKDNIPLCNAIQKLNL